MSETINIRPWKRLVEWLPPLARSEREALKESIRECGVKIPILVFSDGLIVDGVHRWEISQEVGVKCPVDRVDLSEDDAFTLGITLNFARRHLSPEQQKEIREKQKKIALELRKQGKTQEEVARIVGIPRNTISFWEGNINNVSADNTYNVPDLRILVPKTERERIYERVKKGENQKQVAADYKISQPRVSQIVKSIEKEGSHKRLTLPEFLNKIDPIFYEFSIWEVPNERPEGGMVDYKGNCSPYVCAGCIYNYAREGDIVMDPMAGSGTFLDVAKEIKTAEGAPAFKEIICYDLNPIREDITRGDATKISEPKESIDFIFVHFPYWNSVDYVEEAKKHGAKKVDEENELSRMPFDKFEEKSKVILWNLHRMLRVGRNLCLMIGPKRNSGKFLDLPRLFSKWACEDEDGPKFMLEDKIIVMTYNPKKISFNAEGKRRLAIGCGRKNNHLNINYDEVLVLKK